MQTLVDVAFCAPGRSVSSKLVLVWLAHRAGSDGRVRVLPSEVASETSLSMRRVEECLAGLNADGLIHAHRWSDSGAWSVRVRL